MKSKSIPFYALSLLAVLMSGCGKNSVNDKFTMASQEYEQLTEKYLQHIADFEWEASYSMLADDVEFNFPDGDQEFRSSFKGKETVKNFWDHYVENSGNDRLLLKNFVHVPVMVNEVVENIDVTGVFNLCYFSAELSYGAEKARVRMHWAFHFNDEKKIDAIYTYYDRTPIIEAANKNFLARETRKDQNNGKVIQVVKLKSGLSEDQLIEIAKVRADRFRAIPGLEQKYYLRLGGPGEYSGVYVWESREAMSEFLKSELAATISEAYQVVEAPNVEISEVMFKLRD